MLNTRVRAASIIGFSALGLLLSADLIGCVLFFNGGMQDSVQGERRPSQRRRSSEGRHDSVGDQHVSDRNHSFADEKAIRRAAITTRVPCITTMSGAKAAAEAVESKTRDPIRVWSLQEIHKI